jgi:hypothetical protein
MIGRYVAAPFKSGLAMSWLVLLQRARRAEKAREHARFDLWESEGGSLPGTYERHHAPVSN